MSKARTKAEIREEAGRNKVFGALQKLGQTFMLPISLLPVAGLLLGIGSTFTNPAVIQMYNLGGVLNEGTLLFGILSILADAGSIVFGNLGLLFGISVAAGLAKREQGVAALSTIIGYFVMYAAMTSTLNNLRDVEALSQTQGLIVNYLGFTNTMNLGVIGGITIGVVVANLHNRYNTIELPDAISFFGGTHFIPIIASIVGVIIGIMMAFVWPLISGAFSSLGEVISGMGILGIFLYVYIYRALIPFGLHHVFYLPFWQTAIGGTAIVNGATVVGAQNIVFAQLAAGVPIDAHAAAHFSYMFPVMLFGIPAACRAMYEAAHESRKSEIKGFYTSSALTSFMTGITEPIEFPMLFASPILYYGVHCVLFGLSGVLAYLLGAGVAVTFSGGIIDFFLYGVLPGNGITSWIPLLFVGVAFAFIYYFMFKFGIKKFGWAVPGSEAISEDDQIVIEDKNYDELDEKQQRAYRIVAGLGGTDNLNNVANCATRLRVQVKDGSKVNKALLETTGTSGTVLQGENVQVIYGTTVPNIKASIEELIASGNAPKESFDSPEKAVEEIIESLPSKESTVVEDVNTKSVEIISPAKGQLVEIASVNDQVFSGKLMGDGFAVKPLESKIVSPIDGEIVMVARTNHAVGIKSEDGLEVLVHMGIDTVALDGKGFELFVKEGDKIKAGDHLANMDLEFIKNEGKETDVIIVFTNSDDMLVNNNIKSNLEIGISENIGSLDLKN